LEDRVSTRDTQSSALKTLESDLQALQTSVESLNDIGGAFSEVSVTSSNNDAVSATAESGTATGTHTVTVSQLATTSSYYSETVSSSSTTLSSGSFDILVGTESSTNQPVSISVDSSDGTNTLSGLASYINDHNLGVTASVVTDSSGARLSLVSQTSGAAGDLTVSDDTTSLGLTKAVTGTDASLTVDGVPVTSSSNTVTGAISGVTLTLSATASSAVTIGITPNTSDVATAINDFISAYNTVIDDINTQNTYDSSTSSASALLGDSAMEVVQQQLLSDITTSVSSNSGYVNLESIGITLQDDGTLSVDSTTLNNALSNDYSAVQNLFQSTSPAGVAYQFNKDLTWLTSTTTGPLNVEMTGISNEVEDLDTQISDFQTQLAAEKEQLTTEYSNINTTLEELPQYLSQIKGLLDSVSSS
jgi:flagellar hook-associated protein 2